MIGTVIIAAIVALLVSSLGTLIALKIQRSYLQRMHIQHKAREQAQEGALRNWEVNQEKRTLGIETKLTTRVQQLEKDWQTWENKDTSRIEALRQQYAVSFMAQQVERELARLPRTEETPLAFNPNGQLLPEFSYWQPPALARADLAERDLSHRYIGQADLRFAQLRGANFFMSDLSGACLVGANLAGADLTGANLSNADLRHTILTNADLQVADLRHTILLGANLHSVRHLTPQQLYVAIYDHTTQLDADIDLTMPRLPSIRRTILKPIPNELAPVVETATPANSEPESIELAAEVLATATETPLTPVLEDAAVPTSENIAESVATTLTDAPTPTEVATATDAVAETPLTNILEMPVAASEAPIEALQIPAETLEASEGATAETQVPTEAVVTIEMLDTSTAETQVADEMSEDSTAETEVPTEALVSIETPEIPTAEIEVQTRAVILPEELVIDEIEYGTNGSNGHNGKHDEQESASENADTVVVPLELSELVKDEPISVYAATAAAADMPLLAPLIFPRSIETAEQEQEDTVVLPAFKAQGSGEEPARSSSQLQPARDGSEAKPEPDFSSPQPSDTSPKDEKVASIQANVSKSRPPLPIDISTQKGKFNGRKRARVR